MASIQTGFLRRVCRPFGGGDDDRAGAGDGIVAVEQPQRLGHIAGPEVVVHGQHVAHDRTLVQRRPPASVQRNKAVVFLFRAEGGHPPLLLHAHDRDDAACGAVRELPLPWSRCAGQGPPAHLTPLAGHRAYDQRHLACLRTAPPYARPWRRRVRTGRVACSRRRPPCSRCRPGGRCPSPARRRRTRTPRRRPELLDPRRQSPLAKPPRRAAARQCPYLGGSSSNRHLPRLTGWPTCSLSSAPAWTQSTLQQL